MFAWRITRNAILCSAILTAIPLFAFPRPKPSAGQMEKKNISLGSAVTVDGKTLAPGDYELLIEGKKVTFEHNKEMVASAACDWKTTHYKSRYDGVVTSDKNVLQEIDFQGSDQALEVL